LCLLGTVGSNPTLSEYSPVFPMASRADRIRLFVAGLAARPRFDGYASSRRVRLEPRQERFFARPFMYLLEEGGALVPVTVAFDEEEWDAAAAALERAGVEADALGIKN
jgi:hypothetical protein